MDAARSKALSEDNTFDSEDEPSPDNFIQKTMAHYRAKVLSGKRHIGEDDGDMEEENQYEYGDMEAASGEADTSDFSTHQFTAKDEARDPMGSDDSEADAAQMDAARSKALSEDNTFDSEDEPSPDNFIQKTMAHYRAKVLSGKRHIGEDDGDMEQE